MKKQFSICLFLLPFLFSFSASAQNAALKSGHWQVSQHNSKNAWAFELVDDGGKEITAVGKRFKSDGKEIVDRSISFFLIEKYKTGELSGAFIETFGQGNQVETGLAIQSEEEGTRLNLTAMNDEGTVTATYTAQWMGRGITAKFQSGKWTVREIVASKNEKWDIEWDFQITENGGTIQGSGNKSIVNLRKAYPGERKTNCKIEVTRNPNNPTRIEGNGTETNHTGQKLRSKYVGWVSPSGKTLLLKSYYKEKLAALLVGRFKGL